MICKPQKKPTRWAPLSNCIADGIPDTSHAVPLDLRFLVVLSVIGFAFYLFGRWNRG